MLFTDSVSDKNLRFCQVKQAKFGIPLWRQYARRRVKLSLSPVGDLRPSKSTSLGVHKVMENKDELVAHRSFKQQGIPQQTKRDAAGLEIKRLASRDLGPGLRESGRTDGTCRLCG